MDPCDLEDVLLFLACPTIDYLVTVIDFVLLGKQAESRIGLLKMLVQSDVGIFDFIKATISCGMLRTGQQTTRLRKRYRVATYPMSFTQGDRFLQVLEDASSCRIVRDAHDLEDCFVWVAGAAVVRTETLGAWEDVVAFLCAMV